MLPFHLIKTIPFAQKRLRQMYMDRANQIFAKLHPHLGNHQRIIDIGCGTGSISKLIKQHTNNQVTLVDVQYNPMCDHYPVIIYDGQHLPFSNHEFHTSLLFTVLHHTHDPEVVLKEAARVTSDKIIILEDIFTDLPSRALTFIGDCLVNWEIHSPFTNHSKKGWLTIFKKNKLTVTHTEEFPLRCIGFPFQLGLYVLKK